jgi:hypothetical protein
MRKSSALDFFGGPVKTAAAIGINPQAVSDWPEMLPPRIADRVIAAAVRAGREVPAEWITRAVSNDSAGQQEAAA